jgi:hypothetical protein
MESTLWALPLTAMTAGLLGSVHCLGMCGGVSGMVAMAAPARDRTHIGTNAALTLRVIAVPHSPPLAKVLAFNLGRVTSYGVAGAIAGSAGNLIGQAWLLDGSFPLRAALFLFAHLMVIITGLYLMGLPQLLAPIERAGGALWRYLSPLTRRFLPLDSPTRAAAFGLLWGWIPCGMVYAMLLSATSAGSAAMGAATMLAFGIGTAPAMLAAGVAAGTLARWTRDARVRIAAGGAIVLLGLAGLLRADSLASLRAFGAFCAQAMS